MRAKGTVQWHDGKKGSGRLSAPRLLNSGSDWMSGFGTCNRRDTAVPHISSRS